MPFSTLSNLSLSPIIKSRLSDFENYASVLARISLKKCIFSSSLRTPILLSLSALFLLQFTSTLFVCILFFPMSLFLLFASKCWNALEVGFSLV